MYPSLSLVRRVWPARRVPLVFVTLHCALYLIGHLERDTPRSESEAGRIRCGSLTCGGSDPEVDQLKTSARSLSSAAFGLAPTICFTGLPPWNRIIVGIDMIL